MIGGKTSHPSSTVNSHFPKLYNAFDSALSLSLYKRDCIQSQHKGQMFEPCWPLVNLTITLTVTLVWRSTTSLQTVDWTAEFNINSIPFWSPPVPDQRRYASPGLYRDGWRGKGYHWSPVLQRLGLGEVKEARVGYPIQTSNSKPPPAQWHLLSFITSITIFIYSFARPWLL